MEDFIEEILGQKFKFMRVRAIQIEDSLLEER
jgi:hypothetical protein